MEFVQKMVSSTMYTLYNHPSGKMSTPASARSGSGITTSVLPGYDTASGSAATSGRISLLSRAREDENMSASQRDRACKRWREQGQGDLVEGA
jgi:hypothetical protein